MSHTPNTCQNCVSWEDCKCTLVSSPMYGCGYCDPNGNACNKFLSRWRVYDMPKRKKYRKVRTMEDAECSNAKWI